MKIYNILGAHATKLLGDPTKTHYDWLGDSSVWATQNGELVIIRWAIDRNGWSIIVREHHQPDRRLDWSRERGSSMLCALSAKRMIEDFATIEDRMSEEAKILRALGLTELALAAGFDLDDIQIYGAAWRGDQNVCVTRRGERDYHFLEDQPDNSILLGVGCSAVSLKIERGDLHVEMFGPPEKLVAALTHGLPVEVA